MKKYLKSFHSVLGILFALPILLIGLSGALLSYESEILKVLNLQTYSVQSNGKKIGNKTELLKKLEKEYKAAVFSVRFMGENAPMTVSLRSNIIDRLDENAVTRHTVYLNPYTDEILPPPENGRAFFRFVRNLHIFLLLGSVGNEIVAISTVYLVLLCISGFILYYKFLQNNFKNALKINFKAKGTKFYYKLHSVFGSAFFVIFIIISLSGLYWSYDWVRNGVYLAAGIEQNNHGHGTHANANTQENLPRFIYAHHLNLENLTKSIKIFTRNYEYENFSIFRHGQTNAFRITYLPKNATHSRATNSLIIHPNGTIMQNGKYEAQKIGIKIVRSMLMIHNGEFFGSVFKVIFCFASAFLMIFAWSGFVLWRNKRVKKVKIHSSNT